MKPEYCCTVYVMSCHRELAIALFMASRRINIDNFHQTCKVQGAYAGFEVFVGSNEYEPDCIFVRELRDAGIACTSHWDRHDDSDSGFYSIRFDDKGTVTERCVSRTEQYIALERVKQHLDDMTIAELKVVVDQELADATEPTWTNQQQNGKTYLLREAVKPKSSDTCTT